MALQPYSPADMRRLKSLQIHAGRSRPVRREFREGLRVVRLVRRPTDSGAVVLTRNYWRKGDHQDVTVRPAPIRVPLLVRRPM